MTTPAHAAARYSSVAIGLHWLVFILILCGFALGVYMTGLSLSPQKLKYYSWHKWIGISVFLLALLRIVWRLAHAAPALPTAMPAWQRRAAAASHTLLYVLIVVIPISGWLHSSATGLPTVYLGLVQLPDLLTRNKALAEILKLVHVSLNYVLFVLVSVHAAAAVRHHFVDHDEVLARMLPFLKPRQSR